LIHVHSTAEKARAALHRTRTAAWNAGNRGGIESDAESVAAAEVTAALAELVALALGIEDAS
jgi:hypothetical protein